jgi:hypothetical protein
MFIAAPPGGSQSLDGVFPKLFAGFGVDASLIW